MPHTSATRTKGHTRFTFRRGAFCVAALPLAVTLLAKMPASAALTSAGSETRANEVTDGVQEGWYNSRQIAMDTAGNFVVVWDDDTLDGSGHGVYARRFDSNGAPLGSQFQVNTHTANSQYLPVVAMTPDGRFVVVWESLNQDGSGHGVYAQRYAADGSPQGGEFRVNVTTANDQHMPAVGMAPDGSFVIAWTSYGQDAANTHGVYARRYAANGTALSGEILVNQTTAGEQQEPAIAVHSDGSFVVAWEDSRNNFDIYARRFNASGSPLDGEFRVNTTVTSTQRRPAISMNAEGGFVIAWESNNQDGDGYGVFARIYNAAGSPQTGEIQVNTHTAKDQDNASVSFTAGGTFAVAWNSADQDGGGAGSYLRLFDGGGTPITGEILANTTTANDQKYASVAANAAGQVAVVWSGNGPGDSSGVFFQRFTLNLPSSITVDTVSDTVDGNTSSLWALLNNPGVDGRISLREAILAANNTAGQTNHIHFNIPEPLINGVHTLALSSLLPTVTRPVRIDATTQPGYTGTPLIVLNGGSTRTYGLRLEAGSQGSEIRGFNIQGFTTAGIDIVSSNNVIAANWIGTNPAGDQAAGNAIGINLFGATGNQIGGTCESDRNLISGNSNLGIALVSGSHGNEILGNFIGVDAAGGNALPNAVNGIFVSSSSGNRIGDGTADGRNVISGNANHGVYAGQSPNTEILGNYIGLDATGSLAIGNGNRGIFLFDSPGVIIGDGSPGARNVISGNNDGIGLSGALTTGVLIQGNDIGLTAVGDAPAGNLRHGISIENAASANLVGGPAAGLGNRIWHQGGVGVNVVGASTVNNAILGNSIAFNDDLGIDLAGDGVTLNDPGDTDTGPNHLRNFPVVLDAEQDGANLDLTFAVDLLAGDYRIEFFANPSGIDGSGFGQGEDYLGAASIITTGASGYETFFASVEAAPGEFAGISATATEDLGGGILGSTSEFGPAFFAAGTIRVTTTSDVVDGDTSSIAALHGNPGGDGRISLREAIIAVNNTPGSSEPVWILFNIPEPLVDGAHTIQPTSPLPDVTRPVIIDGTSEPDYAVLPVIEIDGSDAGPANGLVIRGGNSTVRGLVINRFSGLGAGRGIVLQNAGGNTIQGNHVGTDPGGLVARNNTGEGVFISDSPNNLIGGSGPGEGNLLSGNNGGIRVNSTGGNLIQGNRIGTEFTGTSAIGNMSNGIWLNSSTNNLIGGSGAGEGNVIGASGGHGILVFGGGDNTVRGNRVGTDVSGAGNLWNGQHGILLISSTSNNTIGGTNAGDGNTIAFNTLAGVSVASGTGNRILGNAIYENGNIGINLGTLGVLPNDPGDTDTGPNHFQNYPVLSYALVHAADLRIVGNLNSTPLSTFRVEFFANTAPDPSGHGEGERFLGFLDVATDASGDAVFDHLFSAAVTLGEYITATATDVDGNTSEFSAYTVVRHPLLAVSSQHGDPVPAVGTHEIVAGTITNAILFSSTDLNGATQYVATGWSGTGDVPATGADLDTGNFVVNSDSSVTWLWATQYWLSVSTSGAGMIDVADGWFNSGSNITLVATPASGQQFSRWYGDIGAADPALSTLNLIMDRPRNITAAFTSTNAIILTLEPTQDTYIKLKDPALNYGVAPQMIVDRESTDLQRALLQFDLGAIPPGATLVDAALELNCTQIGGRLNIGVYEVLESWSEGGGNGTAGAANWNQRQPGLPWTTAGGSHNTTAEDLYELNSTGRHSWDVGALVALWHSGSRTNHGFMVASPDGGGNRTATYDSREGTVPPLLRISYLPPPVFFIEASAGDNGTIAPSDPVSIVYGASTSFVVTAAANHHIVDIGTNGVSVGPFGQGSTLYTQVFSNVTADQTIDATFAIDRFDLVVSSPYGTPSPALGTNTYDHGTVVSSFVPDSPVVHGTTQHVATGWVGTGDVPATGTGTDAGPFTMTQDSSVTWLWTTQYWLAVSTSGPGTVDVGDGWHESGSNVSLEEFAGLTGLDRGAAAGAVARARDLDLLNAVDQRLEVTTNGRRCLNDLQALFLP